MCGAGAHWNSNMCYMLFTNSSSFALNVDLTTRLCLRTVKSVRFALPLLLCGFTSPSLSSHDTIALPTPTQLAPLVEL